MLSQDVRSYSFQNYNPYTASVILGGFWWSRATLAAPVGATHQHTIHMTESAEPAPACTLLERRAYV